jgi:hypothetical protein
MVSKLKLAVAVGATCVAIGAQADVRFFERDGFAGRTFIADHPVGNLERFGFNDRASSAVVRGGRWEVCEDARFAGRCVVLRPGRYPDLRAMGLNNQVSSVRPADGRNVHHDRDYRSSNDYYDRGRY